MCLPRLLQEGSSQSIDVLAGVNCGRTFDASQVWTPRNYFWIFYDLSCLVHELYVVEHVCLYVPTKNTLAASCEIKSFFFF